MSVRSLNKVMLIGNLTRDPELRYTPQGTAVCTFGVATNRQWTPSEGGERQEEVEFHRIVAWAKLAEICAQILHKGRKVYVEGRLQTRNWTGQDGQERTTTEIVIDTMIAMGPPRPGMPEESEEFSQGEAASKPKPAAVPDEVSAPEKADESEKKKAPVKPTKPAKEAAAPEPADGEEKKADEEFSEDDIPF
ncbi:MAG: hypothetical protein A2900_04670 [Candidatus Chisholmbacteria bacterium RIFCSPLOWO2_01_FULL_50_28]|uniref:Single-stranded DNA-binding protein n=1 Tax=Candidatus Chisholmbacteria bacterium RIFCSPHIGHO2_01_FULL_52_32 TaxID=1797591 RepID=A0A1G1VSV3_9BACT|nr:MAG: hypothetical protein A2786_02075 [Candidatus Chisholmbacteria bacterium RIFCSPHIGHO2_01_FULL_52_32]OGY20340.1 MAG: hypothetical protein A2900_04670 [Candidatus Chisholmbacteria bacterium RIFCSPLOWO2_01_FULL_50_28]